MMMLNQIKGVINEISRLKVKSALARMRKKITLDADGNAYRCSGCNVCNWVDWLTRLFNKILVTQKKPDK